MFCNDLCKYISIYHKYMTFACIAIIVVHII